MNNLPLEGVMHKAFINKDISFEGIFYTGVKTACIFCRPTCSVKKPELKNVEFFSSTKDTLLAGFIP